MIFEPFKPFVASEFHIKQATETWERRGAAALRRQVFCEEQGIFDGDDRDATDDIATPLVAVSLLGVAAGDVVGTVRIHPAELSIWWGSRLAVAADYRRVGSLGASLIRLAVSSARARGCRRFLANVQSQNEPMFLKLRWRTLSQHSFHGRPHCLMEADLPFYPPMASADAGFHALAKTAA